MPDFNKDEPTPALKRNTSYIITFRSMKEFYII